MQKSTVLYLKNVISCKIVERINRFVVKVNINNKYEFAYSDNTGRLDNLLFRGNEGVCILKEGGNYKYRLIAIKDIKGYSLIDTKFHSFCFKKLLSLRRLPFLRDAVVVKRNVKIYTSVIDYLLKDKDGKRIYVELKSATRRENLSASYPDAPTLRGRRHIKDLIKIIRFNKGVSMIIFVCSVPHAQSFKPALEVDYKLSVLLKRAYLKGVKIKAFSLVFDKDSNSIVLENPSLKVILD